MKRLDRYLIREIIPPFVMGVMVVVVMFQVNFYMALGKNDLTRNVPPMAILKIIFLETPGFLSQTLPIAVSLATSLALSRLARESELTALRSAGTRVLRVVFPTAIFGLVVGLINFWVVDKVTPAAARKSFELQTNVGVLAGAANFMSNVPLRLQSYTVSLGTVVTQPNDTLDLKDILLIERPEPGVMVVIVSPTGSYAQGIWSLKNVISRTFRSGSAGVVESRSRDFKINQKIVIRDLAMMPAPKELGVVELGKKIQELKKLGQYTRNLEIEYHIKFSTPAMCVIFAMISPIFSIALARQGGFIGVLISMAIVMVYFNAWVVSTQIIGKNPNVDPAMAAWLPNIIFLGVALIGLRRLE